MATAERTPIILRGHELPEELEPAFARLCSALLTLAIEVAQREKRNTEQTSEGAA